MSDNIPRFYYPHVNSTADGSLGPFNYDQDLTQYKSVTQDLPLNGFSAPNNIPRSMAGKGHGDGYSQNNLYSVPRSQDDMATHGRLDHDAWKGEWDGGGAQVFAPSVRPFRLPDTQFPSIPPSPSHSPSGSIGSSSDSPRAVGSEALVKFTKNRRKKPALFKCEFKNCDRDFTTKANQKHHINSHWGIKPYSCGQCGRGFSVGHARQRHLKTCIKTVFKQPSDFMQRGGVEESLYPMLQVFPLSTPSPHPASMRFSA